MTLSRDEGNRPDTTLEQLRQLKPVRENGVITASNASQLSDGASACVVTSEKLAARARSAAARPLSRDRGRGLRAGRNGHRAGVRGPEAAEAAWLARLRHQPGELNEAFAVQALCCREKLGIDPEIYNVNGGGISIGHPYGMSGARLVGHALIEGRRRGVSMSSSP